MEKEEWPSAKWKFVGCPFTEEERKDIECIEREILLSKKKWGHRPSSEDELSEFSIDATTNDTSPRLQENLPQKTTPDDFWLVSLTDWFYVEKELSEETESNESRETLTDEQFKGLQSSSVAPTSWFHAFTESDSEFSSRDEDLAHCNTEKAQQLASSSDSGVFVPRAFVPNDRATTTIFKPRRKCPARVTLQEQVSIKQEPKTSRKGHERQTNRAAREAPKRWAICPVINDTDFGSETDPLILLEREGKPGSPTDSVSYIETQFGSKTDPPSQSATRQEAVRQGLKADRQADPQAVANTQLGSERGSQGGRGTQRASGHAQPGAHIRPQAAPDTQPVWQHVAHTRACPKQLTDRPASLSSKDGTFTHGGPGRVTSRVDTHQGIRADSSPQGTDGQTLPQCVDSTPSTSTGTTHSILSWCTGSGNFAPGNKNSHKVTQAISPLQGIDSHTQHVPSTPGTKGSTRLSKIFTPRRKKSSIWRHTKGVSKSASDSDAVFEPITESHCGQREAQRNINSQTERPGFSAAQLSHPVGTPAGTHAASIQSAATDEYISWWAVVKGIILAFFTSFIRLFTSTTETAKIEQRSQDSKKSTGISIALTPDPLSGSAYSSSSSDSGFNAFLSCITLKDAD